MLIYESKLTIRGDKNNDCNYLSFEENNLQAFSNGLKSEYWVLELHFTAFF